MGDYHNLLVWQRAFEFTKLIYRLVRHFPKEERYRIVDQLCRAALSIIANIAEGRGRKTDKDFVRFLYLANGSLLECECFLELSRDLGFINQEQYEFIEDKRKEVGYLLDRLIKSISKA